MTKQTGGELYIHSAPSALCPHVEWAASSVFGVPVKLDWTEQPVEPRTYRAECAWHGAVGSAARLVSDLQRWQEIRFEMTEDPTVESEGMRYSYTPALGLFAAMTGLNGDIIIPEDRLRDALENYQGMPLVQKITSLLGQDWDEELEEYRCASSDDTSSWLRLVS
jgi:hypothetical protein